MKHLLAVADRMDCNIAAASSAIELIASADLIHHMLTVYRSGEIDDYLPGRPEAIEKWESLYEGGISFLRAIADSDPSLLGLNGAEADSLFRDLAGASRLARKRPEDFRVLLQDSFEKQELLSSLLRSLRLAPRAFRISLARVSRELRSRVEIGVIDYADQFVRSPAFLFYLRVLLPCVMRYQIHPRAVLCGARKGEHRMIEILSRIDPWACNLQPISRWLNHPAGVVRRQRKQTFLRWQQEGIDHEQFSRKRVKQYIGGFAHLMIQATGTWLDCYSRRWTMQPPKVDRRMILDLFHAVEKERTGNPMAEDPDLCELQPSSFYKQIQRRAVDWRPLLVHPRRTKVA